MEGKVPWWRKVLDFALGGIRSGFGLFSKNGKPLEEVQVETASAVLEPQPVASQVGEQPVAEPEPVMPEFPESELPVQQGREPEPESEPVVVKEPVAAESETAAVETVPVEAAAPHENKSEVTLLEFVAAEVENQEDERALTESSPQSEKISAEEVPAHAVPSQPEPAVEAVAPEQNFNSTPAPVEHEGTAELAEEPTVETSTAGPQTAAEPVQQLLPLPELTQEQKTAVKVAAMLKARGQDADQSPFSVIVSKIYDGPLDLLLDLIRKQDIDIYDIPIAKITAQFLAYVDRLRESDMDVAGDFIYTAALLIHIKSKLLLPRAPAGPDDATDDPRRELVERLLEHERFKNAAQMLHEKQTVEAATWTNPGMREFREDAGAEPELAADTTDLVRIFREILDRARNRPIFNVQEDTVTVGQMIQFLARRLTMEDRPVALRRLLSHTNSERALIAMFLALLEMVRLQAILLKQDRQFSEIFIKKHTGFEASMNQGLADARDDWR
jgi:segregation and condensation protein A